MSELTTSKKIKIHLNDYDYKRDIENRLQLSKLSFFDVQVLEEILYSSIKTSIMKLLTTFNITTEELSLSLKKFQKMGLISWQNDVILVDKKMRRYFEFYILKFDQQFTPNMEYFQSILKFVPIHVLPQWYSIPRTSNNIFLSIVEKFLLTPHIFYRHLDELIYNDKIIQLIVEKVFIYPFKVKTKTLEKLLNISKIEIQKYLLYLEYSLACCQSYEKQDEHYEEIVTPYHEWKEYLTFTYNTNFSSIGDTEAIERKRDHDFAFVEDLTSLLQVLKQEKFLPLNWEKDKLSYKKAFQLAQKCKIFTPDEMYDDNFVQEYISSLINNLIFNKFIEESTLNLCSSSYYWLSLSLEEKALYLYQAHSQKPKLPSHLSKLYSEKELKEAEKCVYILTGKDWVLFDDFIKGLTISLREDQTILLIKDGKNWKYQIPHYNNDDISFVKNIIFNPLFEAGIVAIGKYEDKDCMKLTNFGRKIFES